MKRLFTIVVIAILISRTLEGAALAGSPSLQQLSAQVTALQTQVTTLQGQVTSLQTTVSGLQSQLSSANYLNAVAFGQYVSVDPNAETGLAGPNVVIKGANVHIVSGSGNTVDSTGLGNLVIGYNEDLGDSRIDGGRTGSHNLVVGPGHQFRASGGVLAGSQNATFANYDTAIGGACNGAGGQNIVCPNLIFQPGEAASVTGGSGNLASGQVAGVSGGLGNVAGGDFSSVSGGSGNFADGIQASVSGGVDNVASGRGSSVSGGEVNTASGVNASISGGFANTANGANASVAGGFENVAGGFNGGVIGGLNASVAGGSSNLATGENSSVGGGTGQIASTTNQNIN